MSEASVTLRTRGVRGLAVLLTRDALLDVVIALITTTPLLLTRHLPLLDLPNHLAQQYIFRDLASSPVLQTFYTVRWALVPNMALELFVGAARQLMSIDLAVRLFCIITILLLFFGTRLVNRVLGGERSRIYRAAPLLCYGGPFQFGFLSFCFGIGLALMLFGLFLHNRRSSLAREIAVFAPCSFLLLLCHLAAFGLFSIAIISFELAHCLARTGLTRQLGTALLKQGGRIAALLAPSLLLFKLFSPEAAASNDMRYSTLHEKAESIAALTLFSSPATELPLLAAALSLLVVALYLKVVRVHRSGFVMAAAFTAIWLALPRVALSGGYIDYRVPWATSFFLLASLGPGQRYVQFAVPFASMFSALTLVRIALISWFWLSWEPALAAIDDALSTLPLGARLMVVEGEPPSVSASRRPPYVHVGAYAVARRKAFYANIFAGFSGQILQLREPYRRIWKLTAPQNLDLLEAQYNYVLVLRPKWARVSPALPLRCWKSGSDFFLLKRVSSDSPPGAADCARP